MKLVSWNVNGIRAAIKHGFEDVFKELDADIFCINETKLSAGQLDLNFPGYESYWNYAERKGYSGTWLAKAARFAALNMLERDSAQKRGGGEAAAVLDELAECVPAPGSVGERLDAEALSRAVDAFLKAQGPRARRVFVQRCFECASIAEIARRNSLSEQAVRSLLHRTRLKLRLYLEKEELL